MPQFKFGQNDIFRNAIKAYPKYTVSMYLNNMYINNRISQGDQVPSGSISLYEMVVNPDTASLKKHRTGAGDAGGGEAIDNYFATASYGFLASGEGGHNISWAKNVGGGIDKIKTHKDWNTKKLTVSPKNLKLNYPILATVDRFLLIGSTGGSYNRLGHDTAGSPVAFDGLIKTSRLASGDFLEGRFVATASNAFKLIALRTAYNDYRNLSPYFDFDKYVLVSGGVPPVRGFYSEGPTGGKAKTWHQNGGKLNKGAGLEVIYNPPGYTLTSFTTPETATSFDNSIPNFTQSIPRNKYTNVIVIPKIMYGEAIKKGSVKLEFYFTGTLVARAEDSKQNGELIETYLNSDACDRTTTGSTIGVVMYNEGVMIITSSVPFRASNPAAGAGTTGLIDGYLCPTGSRQLSGGGGGKCCGADSVTVDNNAWPPAGGEGAAMSSSYVTASSWAHFGAYKSLVTASNAHLLSASYSPCSSSYLMEFKGTTHIPVLTMLAHANKNELNWSNNPSYISSDNRNNATVGHSAYINTFVDYTSSHEYKEREEIKIKNTISSSFAGHSASFKPQTFISKIGIYNENKELIAITKLANPVKKTSDLDFTFKMKLDL